MIVFVRSNTELLQGVVTNSLSFGAKTFPGRIEDVHIYTFNDLSQEENYLNNKLMNF